MPSPWNDASDRRLLLAIIHSLSPSPPNWHTVAEHMGEGYTAESTRQHFAKLRKESDANFGASKAGAESAEPATPKTPKARAKKTTADGTPASAKRKKKNAVKEEDDDGRADSPLGKKMKVEDEDVI